MNKAMVRTLSGASLGAISLLLAGHASAQTQPPPPPQLAYVDQNGVDLTSRDLIINEVDLAIGPNDHRGLKLARQWAGEVWRISSTPVISGSATDPIVVLDGKSTKFTKVGSTYVPEIQNGSSLSGDMKTFTSSDGTVIDFQMIEGLAAHPAAIGAASKVTYPDGVEHSFTYQQKSLEVLIGTDYSFFIELARLLSVNSSTGYQLKFNYQTNNDDFTWTYITDVTAINNAEEDCDPAANSCNLNGQWPTISYEAGLFGGPAFAERFIDAEGRVTTVNYTNNKITSITPAGSGNAPISYAYDANGKVETVTRGGGAWSYSVSQLNGQTTTTVQDPVGNSRNAVTDSEGFLVRDAEGGNATEYDYCTGNSTCPSGRVQRITSPEQNYTTFAYDARGNVTSQTSYRKPNSDASLAPASITTSATYPVSCSNPKTCNKPTSITDGEGNVTNYSWSPTHGGLTEVKAPADPSGVRPTTSISYGSVQAYYKSGTSSWTNSGPIYVQNITRACRTAEACAGTANEMIADLNYSAASVPNNALPTQVQRKTGNSSIVQTTNLAYTDLGDVASMDGPLAGTGDKSVMFYNKARQPVGMIGPGDSTYAHLASRTVYDDAGRVWKQEQGYTSGQTEAALAGMTFRGRTVTSYDAHGRPKYNFIQDASGSTYSTSQISYDAASRVTCAAQRMNPSTYSNLPADACVLASKGAYGNDRITKYTYDNRNRVTKVTEGFGTASAAESYTVTFTPNGQIKTAMDAESNLTTYEYDGLDRNYKVRFPVKTKGAATSSTTDFEQYSFDKNGNVLTFRTRRGETLALNYDDLNRLTSKIVPERSGLDAAATRDVYYAYDLFGNLTSARFWGQSGGQGLTFEYDGLGRMTAENSFGLGVNSTIVSGYDPKTNQRTSMTYPDGNQVTYSYDVMGRPDTVKLNGANVARYLFRQDGLPDKVERFRNGGSWDMATTFGFNAQSRMNSLGYNHVGTANDASVSFTHNPAGQIFQRTQSNAAYAHPRPSNSQFAYTSNGLNQYEAAGNLDLDYDANGNLTSDGNNTFTYDVENRLVSRSSGGTNATMWYDPLGRLYAVNSSNTPTRKYVYDGDALVMEYNWDGSVIQDRYLHGPGSGVDDPLVQFSGSSVAIANREYLYADERGSIVAIGDASGGITNVNTYDPYGVQGPGNTGRFQYTGQIWIPEMDLYYYKARMYSAELGRFMQTDPIGYGDGMNMYRYVANDPVNGIDPSGLACRTYVTSRTVTYYDHDNDGRLSPGDEVISVEDNTTEVCDDDFNVPDNWVPHDGGGRPSDDSADDDNQVLDALACGGGVLAGVIGGAIGFDAVGLIDGAVNSRNRGNTAPIQSPDEAGRRGNLAPRSWGSALGQGARTLGRATPIGRVIGAGVSGYAGYQAFCGDDE